MNKEQIRAAHRRRRRQLDHTQLQTSGEAIASHGMAWAQGLSDGRPGAFAVYLGVGTEPPTLPLIRALHQAGHTVLLPVCEPKRLLAWVVWTPSTVMSRSAYAPIDEPEGERLEFPVHDVAGIFLPATAVDRSGNRIGQGGGYYDRFLSGLAARDRRIPTIAVVFDWELLPEGSIGAEEFDQKVDGALTPGGLATFPPSTA